MEEEPNAAFWYGFQAADRDIHRPCLLTKRPCHSLDVPFNLKIYFVAYVHVKPLHTRNSSRFGYTSFSFGEPSVDFPLTHTQCSTLGFPPHFHPRVRLQLRSFSHIYALGNKRPA